MIKIRQVILGGLIGAAAISPTFAQTDSQPAGYEVPDGPVEIYGQKLEPEKIDLGKNTLTDYPVYTWSDLKGNLPSVLPAAKTETKSPESLCDHIVNLHTAYEVTLEKLEQPFIQDLTVAYPDNAAYEVTERTASPSPEALNDLVKATEKMVQENYPPEKREKAQDIMIGRLSMLRDVTVDYLTLLMVRDAALDNCPIHAAQKGYQHKTKYDGPDKDYDPEKDPGWDDVPWANKP